MSINFRSTLRDLLDNLSEKNYDESFARCRLLLNIGATHGLITSQEVNDDLWRIARLDALKVSELIHPTVPLLIRFIGDIEADQKISRHVNGLHSRRCTSTLSNFFEVNLSLARAQSGYGEPTSFFTNVNLIAHWANLGYVEEEIIRDQILQSLLFHPTLYDHQAGALLILFKLAGATFEAYADPPVVHRCFELLRNHSYRGSVKIQLRQEVIDLRACDWDGLPPPPVLTTGRPNPISSGRKDPAVPPVITCLGLPSGDLETQVPQPPPLEPVVTPEATTIPGSLAPHSPSISIATLSDFTIADTVDDEPPLDTTTITPHDTFYLEDGNVEVLCGNTLFRVNTSVLSFNSPVLTRMFTKANLASAESPNGCPRILSSDAAPDFVTLLKVIYLPEFPERNKVPDFTTFSSVLRITAKYEMPAVRSRLLDTIREAYPETFASLMLIESRLRSGLPR